MIFNRKSSLIIKECSSFIKNVCYNHIELQNKIDSKINKILREKTKENIEQSKCGINRKSILGLQKEKIEILLIFYKSGKIRKYLEKKIIDKLSDF